MNAKMAHALAVHMRANMATPTFAPMLTVVFDSRTFRIMMNITVAMTLAPTTRMPLRSVSSMISNVPHRLYTDARTTNPITKEKQVPARNRANIHFEAVSKMFRMSVMLLGSVTEDSQLRG